MELFEAQHPLAARREVPDRGAAHAAETQDDDIEGG
jgi:hypothetical protein